MQKAEENKNTPQKGAGPADYLANERTFLAWIRTSIALMAFGFVIVRFNVFVRQTALLANQPGMAPDNSNSTTVGIALVALGAITTTAAYFRYRSIERKLAENRFFPSQVLSVIVTVSVVAACILMVLYLSDTI